MTKSASAPWTKSENFIHNFYLIYIDFFDFFINWIIYLILIEVLLWKINSHTLTFQQQNKIFLIISSLWVLPVHIKTIKTTLPEEVYSGINESLPGIPWSGHFFKFLGSEWPSSNCQKNLQLWVYFLQVDNFFVESGNTIFRFVIAFEWA